MSLNYYLIIIGSIVSLIMFFKLPRLGQVQKKAILPVRDRFNLSDTKLSIIIPARNEAMNLPGILDDLRRQTALIHEVICVDDNSEDETEQIIKDFHVRCVKLSELPTGWKGKPWACQNGARAAAGNILLFLDADIRLAPTAVEALIRRYLKTGRPVSVQPYHLVKKPHEYFSLFFNLIEIAATAMSMLGMKKTYGLYGPVILVEKTIFDQFNGFDVVKNNVAEDLNLGSFYNKQGIDVDLLMGGDEISFRMYPRSFTDLWEGWAKNFSFGAISVRWWILTLLFFWITALNALPIELVISLTRENYVQFTGLCGFYLFNALMIHRVAHRAGHYPWLVSLLFPIYLVLFEILFLYSIFATFVFKTTTWKGRKL